jgi:hypothetical protein
MKQKTALPKTDSIDELARFWDTHDLTDFEDQLEVVTEPVFVRAPDRVIDDTTLIGRAKELEVAGMLIRNGIYVFLPLVDTGADLLATNRDASRCIPIQVKYAAKSSSLGLTKADTRRFKKPNTILAFLVGKVGKVDKQRAWFLPFREWEKRSKDTNNRVERIYMPINENADWLTKFQDDAGIRRVFSELLPSSD